MSLSDLRQFFDLIEVSPDGWPRVCVLAMPNEAALMAWAGYPLAALPTAGRVGSGSGLTRAEAERSAIGEAVEIASLCRWGDEKVVRASAAHLPGDVVTPEDLNGFSDDQIRHRSTWNERLTGLDWIPAPFDRRRSIDWVQGTSSTGINAWLPAEAVFLGEGGLVDPGTIAVADTNGSAAGVSDGDARLRAMLELIERDATGRWWYGQRSRPMVAADRLSQSAGLLLEWIRQQGGECRIFDITTDIGVPVVAAAANLSPDGCIALGFAARLRRDEAVQSALEEMMQMLLKVEAARITGDATPSMAGWLAAASFSSPPLSLGQDVAECDDAIVGSTEGEVVDRLVQKGIRMWFFDQTRPEFAIPVWRIVSPDLCHWKPRFGRARLLQADRHDLNRVSTVTNSVLLAI